MYPFGITSTFPPEVPKALQGSSKSSGAISSPETTGSCCCHLPFRWSYQPEHLHVYKLSYAGYTTMTMLCVALARVSNQKTLSPRWYPQDHAEPLRNHLENCLHCQSLHLKSLTLRIFDGTWPIFCKGGFVLVMHLAEFGIWSSNQFKPCCLRTAKWLFVRAS